MRQLADDLNTTLVQAIPTPPPTMSAQSLDAVSVGDKNSRTLFRVVILAFIAGAAISSRLFSVIRKWTRRHTGDAPPSASTPSYTIQDTAGDYLASIFPRAHTGVRDVVQLQAG